MSIKSPTGITAVAEEAGVSVSTVSQVLGGNRPVGAKTRSRVEAAIEKLNYRPHPGARSLRSQRTESVALIVPDITNPFYPLVAAGMNDILLPSGYLLSVNDAALPSANISEVLRHVLARRVDGIVLGTYGLSTADLRLIADSRTRVVALGRDVEISGSDYVESDDRGGFVKVVEHLIETGRRNIGFIGGEANAHPNQLRLQGYHDSLSRSGLPVEDSAAVFTSFTREGGRAGVDSLYRLHNRWDAIVCANDLIAVGAMERLRALGLGIPDDVAVTGYDDIDAASLLTPSLTTVENPARDIGRTAARLLLERFTQKDDGVPTQHITLSNRLVIRGSTAIPLPR